MNHVQVELMRAKALIEDESKWTKHAYARNECGASVHPGITTACQWCAVGALVAVGAGRYARTALDEAAMTGPNAILSPQDVNDDFGHAATLGMLDRAIEIAGKRGER